MNKITEEHILREKIRFFKINGAELGSPEYWKTEGYNEAADRAKEIVEDYLEKKGL